MLCIQHPKSAACSVHIREIWESKSYYTYKHDLLTEKNNDNVKKKTAKFPYWMHMDSE